MRTGLICLLLLAVSIPVSIVLAGDRDVAELFVKKGQKAWRGKRYEEAADYYRRALDEHTPFPEAAFELGRCLEKLGRTEEAIQAYLTCQDHLREIEKPTSVRYAWANSPTATLFNRDGLPASPFRTDDW